MWTVIKYVFWVILILLLVGVFIQDEIADWDKYLSYREKQSKRRERKLRIKIFLKECKRDFKKLAKEFFIDLGKEYAKLTTNYIKVLLIVGFVIALIGIPIIYFYEK